MVLLAVGATLLGCRSSREPSYPKLIEDPKPYVPSAGTSNAFDGYARAALMAEQADPKNVARTNFTPGQRAAALSRTARAVELVASSTRLKCEFEYRPPLPFEAPPYQQGWLLIGRVFAWRIEDAGRAAQYDTLARNLALATRFGYDLTGGGASDVSLGCSIVDRARSAAAPFLGKMGAGQLNRLAASVEAALNARPQLEQAVDNEGAAMLRAVQFVQDCYAKQNFEPLREGLGPEVRDAIQYLRELRSKDDAERIAYFDRFAQEAREETVSVRAAAALPTAQRAAPPVPAYEERPWRRFAKHFFSVRGVLPTYDRTLARTRLLVLKAGVLAQVKASKVAPSNLGKFDADTRTDPYSGKPFVYRADGADFKLYSVGENLRDDGGQTDAANLSPDLLLESDG